MAPQFKRVSPQVSVLMTVYNSVSHLKDTIESILQQTFRNFEYIIIDDGSTDGSVELIRKFAAMDPRIRPIFLEKNHGRVYASNYALSNEVRAPLIARIDSDDISAKDRLEKQVKYMDEHSEIGLLGGSIAHMREDGKMLHITSYPSEKNSLYRKIFIGCLVCHPACMMRKELVNQVGAYYPFYHHGSEDYDLFLRIYEKSGVSNLQDILLYKRQSASSQKKQRDASDIVSRIAAVYRMTGRGDPVCGLKGGEYRELFARLAADLGTEGISKPRRSLIFSKKRHKNRLQEKLHSLSQRYAKDDARESPLDLSLLVDLLFDASSGRSARKLEPLLLAQIRIFTIKYCLKSYRPLAALDCVLCFCWHYLRFLWRGGFSSISGIL